MRRLTLVLLFVAAPLLAGEVLDNAAVVRLAAAGLGPDVIILKIERSPTAFDTTTDALVALKQAHVPDEVIRAMLLKGDGAASASSAPPPPARAADTPPASEAPEGHHAAGSAERESPRPELAAETCATLRFYTLGEGGWGRYPAYVCVGTQSVSVDEQSIPLTGIVVHCSEKPLFGGLPEWWFRDDEEMFKFQGKAEELDRLSAALTRARGSVPHGGCNEGRIRRLLGPATPPPVN